MQDKLRPLILLGSVLLWKTARVNGSLKSRGPQTKRAAWEKQAAGMACTMVCICTPEEVGLKHLGTAASQATGVMLATQQSYQILLDTSTTTFQASTLKAACKSYRIYRTINLSSHAVGQQQVFCLLQHQIPSSSVQREKPDGA